MPDEPENLTVRLLQEMRASMDQRFDEMRDEIRVVRQEQQASDAENAAILGALVSDVGRVKEAVLEFVLQNKRLRERVEALEDRPQA